MTRRLAVLISGSGSNLQAIIDAIAAGQLAAQVVVVASNRREAYGLTRAERAGIPIVYFPFKPYREAGRPREDYDADLAAQVAAFAPELVVLAGWMHVLSPAFLDRFPGRVLNLHPALPGQFPGVHAIQRAYEAFQRGEIDHTGVMVHWVVPEVDAGPVIASADAPILPGDSLEDLEARIHAIEHRLLVQAIAQVLRAMPYQVTLPITVHTYDIDFAGIVSNIVYIRWLEDLRLRMLDEFFPLHTAMQRDGIAPVLLRTEIDYQRAIRLFDPVQGRMWLAQAGPVRQVLQAEFTVNGRVHAVARQTTCFINLASGRPTPTPKSIRELVVSA